MSLLSLANVSFAWGGPPLLDGIDFEVDQGERIGLLGRNGMGKSTLLKILIDEIAPDDGTIRRSAGLRMARMIQEVPHDLHGSVIKIVGKNLNQTAFSNSPYEEEWQQAEAVERVISKMKLEGDALFESLSSGMKRRVLLANALVHQPDILLLDEPTNHLDIDSINWLEGFLKGYEGTLIFITHDRAFLQALATRIIEIDRGQLFDWSCDYPTFLSRKAASLDAEEKQNSLFDRKLAEEEIWIRKGIKARRTRNEGRVRALKKMREEHRQRRKRVGNVQMQAAEAERSGRLVIEARNISFSYDDQPIVSDLSLLISRGDKLGIIGPNGSGKSTLLKLLLQELKPDSGSVRHGTNLEVSYYDQLREQIDDEQTVANNVSEGKEILTINGKQKHVYSYLQDFLFTPERARRPARHLSGGERNRLMLAKLFKRESNLMILDEPTNDLDAETLELLEELIANYAGTLLLVSHDRTFLNNVITDTIAFEGNGVFKEYAGGYDDYLRQKQHQQATTPKTNQQINRAKKNLSDEKKTVKLSFKQKQELEELPHKIDRLEQQQQELHSAMSHPDFFKQSGANISSITADLSSLEEQLKACYARWEELDSIDT